MKAKSLRQRIRDRIAYERTFTLSERWERGKEKLAQHIVWHVLPKRLRYWTVVHAHVNATPGHKHPQETPVLDLYAVNAYKDKAVTV